MSCNVIVMTEAHAPDTARPDTETAETWLTVQEFAKAAGVSTRTVFRHIAKGLPHERRRSERGHPRIVIAASQVERFVRCEP